MVERPQGQPASARGAFGDSSRLTSALGYAARRQQKHFYHAFTRADLKVEELVKTAASDWAAGASIY